MSAFIVSQTHIDALITAAKAYRYPSAFPQIPLNPERLSPLVWNVQDDPDAFGRALWLANIASVQARYPRHDHSDDVIEARAYRFTPHPLSPVSLLKQIECFEHQASEVSDWPDCWARGFCDALRKAVISTLPGFEAAPWGIGN